MGTMLLRSVRATLLSFSTVLLLPVLAFASVLLWQSAVAEQTRYETEARVAAQRLSAAIDLELTRMQVAAEALATSPTLDEGDYGAFHRQALDAIRVWSHSGSEGFAFVLRDATGRQVVNTRFPWGRPLPSGANPEVDQAVLASKRSVNQGLFIGATAGRPIISIRVPVLDRAGEATHVLSMAINPDRFAEIAAAQKLPADWVGAVLDQSDKIVARSRDQARFLGQLAPEDFRRNARESGGVWTGIDLYGVPVLGVHHRSELSGWRSFVGVPLATARAPLRQWLLLTGALGLLSLALSVGLAVPFGRRMTRAVAALKEAAIVLGQGAAACPRRTGIRELDDVGGALADASVRLREREAALRASEGRLRATHANAGVGIAEVNAEGRITYVNDAECRLVGRDREDLIGRAFLDATHPDDAERDLDLFRRQVRGEFDLYNIEKRYVRADGGTGQARISSTAVRDIQGNFLYAVRVVEDITERQKAETRQRLLVNELNHRVKNTLATVQSLAFQTFRQGLPADVARAQFEDRLLSLSRTHNLLNETSWTGARLSRILSLELEPYAGERPDRIVATGPDLELGAKEAVVMGMVIHELATNAAKVGALSVREGRVEVSWQVGPTAAGPRLHLLWRERDGPPVAPPTRTGFGTRLIERCIRGELAGQVTQTFAPEGFVCEAAFVIDADAIDHPLGEAAE